MANRSIGFFDNQFVKQVAGGDFALNPFEKAVLPFVHGRVLDLGCGLGNLSIEAAKRGADVIAVDASAAAIERIARVAKDERLPIEAVLADAAAYPFAGEFDAIVAIGLLMFLPRDAALRLLSAIREHVVPGGVAALNVLVEGTTYMEMFDPSGHCLFGPDELQQRLAGWTVLLSRRDSFDAPGGTKKEFSTLVARKPAS